MPLLTAALDLDLARLPVVSDQLSARFERRLNANGDHMLLMYPGGVAGDEATHARWATGMRLALVDRNGGGAPIQAGRMGQIIVTAERLLGMFVEGTAAGRVIDDSKGAIFAFACRRDDLASAEVSTNWRGKPVDVFFNSLPGQTVPFRLHVFSLVATLNDEGGAATAHLPDLLYQLGS
jgi:hypothetical protein